MIEAYLQRTCCATPANRSGTRTQFAGAGYADWAEVVLADLQRAHPDVRGLVDHIEIAFWGHGEVLA